MIITGVLLPLSQIYADPVPTGAGIKPIDPNAPSNLPLYNPSATPEPSALQTQSLTGQSAITGQQVTGAKNDDIDCGIFSGNFFSTVCIARGVANLVFIVVQVPTAIILWLSGQFFNISISTSLDNKILNAPIVADGWHITQGLANMFFIFIILYIAIATILQLSGYGMKELLAKVIIIALLVNFSLVFAKLIIDGSNVLALEFYNKISAGGDLAANFIKGFNPQKILSPEIFEKNVGAGGTITIILMSIITMALGGAINLLAAFVLFVAALLFVIRTVVLIFLMIIAPLAFVAMALPKLKAQASQWWETLFNQAFFAPAFLFLFMIVIMLINSSFLKDSMDLAATTFDQTNGVLNSTEQAFKLILMTIIQFIILGAFMLGSLVVAKKMAATGTYGITAYADKAGKWVQGKAKRYSQRGAGYLAEKTLQSDSGIAKFARSIPLASRSLAKVSSWREKQMKDRNKAYAKDYGSYSEAGLEAMSKDPTLFDSKRKAIEKSIAQKTTEKEQKRLREEEDKQYEENIKPENIEKRKKDTEAYKTRIANIEAEAPTLLRIEDKAKLAKERGDLRDKIKEIEKMENKIEKTKERKARGSSTEERLKKLESGTEEKPAGEKSKEGAKS